MLYNIDPRDKELAKMLVSHSVAAKKGETVMVVCRGIDTLGLGSSCMEELASVGAIPMFKFSEDGFAESIYRTASQDVLQGLADIEMANIQRCDGYIVIAGNSNPYQDSDIPSERLNLIDKIFDPPFKHRVNKTRWVVLRYPTASFAQAMQKNRNVAADFYYNACLADYAYMTEAVKPLEALMNRSDKVRIVGPDTQLEFSIKGMPAVPCCGKKNVPDGECYTAPVRDSVNGVIKFNVSSIYDSMPFDDITLTFKNGKVIEAKASTEEQTKNLNAILDRDEGARYVGEFSFGFHPTILHPMKCILFDEKICGSFHMAMGSCYDDAPNGNDSTVHWDMVSIQRPDYQVGSIYLDNVKIREHGIFLPPELSGLNPDNFPKK